MPRARVRHRCRPDRARRYPSDMTDAEWAAIRPLLPVPAWLQGRGGRPEGYCHRQASRGAVRGLYLLDRVDREGRAL
ncbi:Putative transposase of IS4/5 family [Streptomyces sp. OV198]|nr:putative transposase of IS4/5 family DUF4096 [Streptomyces sp. Ag82_O1-15]SOE72981.1 Putative transposase of IS4/5 family [Streptomyces sp. OV198]